MRGSFATAAMPCAAFILLMEVMPGQTAPEIRLTPNRIIRLTDFLPDNYKGSRVVVHAAEAAGDSVAFLVTPRDISGQIVLTLDANGRRKGSFVVPRRVWTNWVDIDADGNVYLARTEQGVSGPETRVIQTNREGHVLNEIPIGRLVLHPGRRIQSGLLVVNEPASISLFRPDGSEQRMTWRAASPPGAQPKVARTLDGGIIILNGSNRRVESLGSDGSSRFAWQMAAKELADAVTRFGVETPTGASDTRACASCSRTIFLGDLATDERGLIYSLLVSGFEAKRGATIFQYDSAGTLTKRIQCATPTFEEFKQPLHNPEGHLVAHGFEVTSNALFLYGNAGIVVIYPPVPGP